MTTTPTRPRSGGVLLREWRERRRLTQLDLANLTGTSSRHLSFVETGRSRPSREMVLRLAEALDVPLADRNQILLAAGHSPSTTTPGTHRRRPGSCSTCSISS